MSVHNELPHSLVPPISPVKGLHVWVAIGTAYSPSTGVLVVNVDLKVDNIYQYIRHTQCKKLKFKTPDGFKLLFFAHLIRTFILPHFILLAVPDKPVAPYRIASVRYYVKMCVYHVHIRFLNYSVRSSVLDVLNKRIMYSRSTVFANSKYREWNKNQN